MEALDGQLHQGPVLVPEGLQVVAADANGDGSREAEQGRVGVGWRHVQGLGVGASQGCDRTRKVRGFAPDVAVVAEGRGWPVAGSGKGQGQARAA